MRMGIVLGLSLLLTGCATGFNRQAIQQRLADQPAVVDDAEIQAALDRKPQLRFPIKLAIHLTAETYYPGLRAAPRTPPWAPDGTPSADWRWTVKDREMIDQWAQPLREAGIVSDLYVMSEMISTTGDPRSIRLAAAKHGADAVLPIKGVSQADSYVDGTAICNLLIIPGYVVPSSHRDVLLLLRGAMWDVGNQCLYLSVDAEGEAKTRAPTFRIKDDAGMDEAKQVALAGFGDELQKRLQALKGTAPAN